MKSKEKSIGRKLENKYNLNEALLIVTRKDNNDIVGMKQKPKASI